MRVIILHGPAANLGTVELEGEQAQDFRGSEAVGARRGARQALYEEIGDRFGPIGSVVTSRDSWGPQGLFFCAHARR